MANDNRIKAKDDQRPLLEQLNDAELGSAEADFIIDALITQDMAWGPARKKMTEAARRKKEDRPQTEER